ncbi:low molecular weight phosphatase family protein [Mycolicibacterium obuense]|uniref:Low molecular weight phosphatase family protein n=1 Tax=Mycolicibacterium obuense TaxID=1807 RepID=A0A4R5XB71_9MYCO|nr:low molecular weight phosphatase family protein [Mycolicibacterium obuense]TDL10600.1 low molecular weight phosphatase family protein [Mycolicibacterium obuense]
MHILFVCTGNICRSPTAERLASAYAQQRGFEGLEASSAGIQAVIGSPMHPTAALVLAGLGGDASNFAARQLTPRIASSADLILTMTAAHRDAVLERNPALLRRTFSMSEVAWLITQGGASAFDDLSRLRPRVRRGDLWDVADPIGRDMDVFSRVGGQIAELVPGIVDLCERSS